MEEKFEAELSKSIKISSCRDGLLIKVGEDNDEDEEEEKDDDDDDDDVDDDDDGDDEIKVTSSKGLEGLARLARRLMGGSRKK